MGLFARAVINGFGFALGAALFKQVSKHLGLDDAEGADSDAHPVDEGGDDGDSAPALC